MPSLQQREAIWKASILVWRAGEKSFLTDDDQKESNNRNKLFVQENIFHEPLRSWTHSLFNERFFTTDEAIIESVIKEREQIKQPDYKMAVRALKGLGYFQDEKSMNSIKARWWFKRT